MLNPNSRSWKSLLRNGEQKESDSYCGRMQNGKEISSASIWGTGLLDVNGRQERSVVSPFTLITRRIRYKIYE